MLIIVEASYHKVALAQNHKMWNLTEIHLVFYTCSLVPCCRSYNIWMFLMESARRHIYLADLSRKRKSCRHQKNCVSLKD